MPKIIVIILVVFLALIFYFRLRPPSSPPTKSITININNQSFSLEIAKTVNQKTKGLSKRSSLDPNQGMIFVFDSEGARPFWMKDTQIDLDIIWLDSKGKIVTIHTAKSQPPDTRLSDYRIYQNTLPAQYVIELNAGTASRLGLATGHTINLPHPL